MGVGEIGYEAVRECRSVHEERPNCSTSGGQSGGGASTWTVLVLVDFLVCDAQSAKEVQDRQLGDSLVLCVEAWGRNGRSSRFPVLA